MSTSMEFSGNERLGILQPVSRTQVLTHAVNLVMYAEFTIYPLRPHRCPCFDIHLSVRRRNTPLPLPASHQIPVSGILTRLWYPSNLSS